LIDGAVVLVVAFVILAGIAAALGSDSGSTNGSDSPDWALFIGSIIVWVIANIPIAVYFGALNGSRRGQTVGKMALGIAVRDARTGLPVGFWRAYGRYFLAVTFAIPLLLPLVVDLLSPLWDPRGQAWHDKATNTVVIDIRS
jgi:uncharacterized RDD family membrane protein YckC